MLNRVQSYQQMLIPTIPKICQKPSRSEYFHLADTRIQYFDTHGESPRYSVLSMIITLPYWKIAQPYWKITQPYWKITQPY